MKNNCNILQISNTYIGIFRTKFDKTTAAKAIQQEASTTTLSTVLYYIFHQKKNNVFYRSDSYFDSNITTHVTKLLILKCIQLTKDPKSLFENGKLSLTGLKNADFINKPENYHNIIESIIQSLKKTDYESITLNGNTVEMDVKGGDYYFTHVIEENHIESKKVKNDEEQRKPNFDLSVLQQSKPQTHANSKLYNHLITTTKQYVIITGHSSAQHAFDALIYMSRALDIERQTVENFFTTIFKAMKFDKYTVKDVKKLSNPLNKESNSLNKDFLRRSESMAVVKGEDLRDIFLSFFSGLEDNIVLFDNQAFNPNSNTKLQQIASKTLLFMTDAIEETLDNDAEILTVKLGTRDVATIFGENKKHNLDQGGIKTKDQIIANILQKITSGNKILLTNIDDKKRLADILRNSSENLIQHKLTQEKITNAFTDDSASYYIERAKALSILWHTKKQDELTDKNTLYLSNTHKDITLVDLSNKEKPVEVFQSRAYVKMTAEKLNTILKRASVTIISGIYGHENENCGLKIFNLKETYQSLKTLATELVAQQTNPTKHNGFALNYITDQPFDLINILNPIIRGQPIKTQELGRTLFQINQLLKPFDGVAEKFNIKSPDSLRSLCENYRIISTMGQNNIVIQTPKDKNNQTGLGLDCHVSKQFNIIHSTTYSWMLANTKKSQNKINQYTINQYKINQDKINQYKNSEDFSKIKKTLEKYIVDYNNGRITVLEKEKQATKTEFNSILKFYEVNNNGTQYQFSSDDLFNKYITQHTKEELSVLQPQLITSALKEPLTKFLEENKNQYHHNGNVAFRVRIPDGEYITVFKLENGTINYKDQVLNTFLPYNKWPSQE